MARQRIVPIPGTKMFETYTDFSGGLNTSTSNEQLRENEYTIMQNVDLINRGGVKKRTGKELYKNLSAYGTPKGIGYFYRRGQQEAGPDIIAVVGNSFYVVSNGGTVFEAPISGVDLSGVENVEMVQYGEIIYIATGVKLCEIGYVKDTFQSSYSYNAGDRIAYAGALYECTTSGVSGTDITSLTVGVYVSGTAKFKLVGYGVSGHEHWYAKVVDPYKPNTNEFVGIGTNALADTPETWVSAADELGFALTVSGILPSAINPVVGKATTFTSYIVYTTDIALSELQYKWEYKESSSSTWKVYKDYGSATQNKAISLSLPKATKYDIRVTARKFNALAVQWTNGALYYVGNIVKYNNNVYQCVAADGGPSGSGSGYSTASPTHLAGVVDYGNISWEYLDTVGESASYTLTNYNVIAADTSVKSVRTIHKCNRILLYWDRLILYGDSENGELIYISHLNQPTYFPGTNSITFDLGKHEQISSIVKYRNYLVVFTPTTIHSLTGNSPADFSRALIHDGVGCTAGRTAQVTGNEILFLSAEGIFRLRPNQYLEEKLNVYRADDVVRYEIPNAEDACAMVYNSQYWISFPTQKVNFRYYYEMGIWSKDVSQYTDATQFLQYAGNVTEFSKSGLLLKHSSAVYTDHTSSYDMIVRTKYHDLAMTFNYKKLKKFYLIARYFDTTDTRLFVTIEADSTIAVTPDQEGIEVVNNEVFWVKVSEPNVNIYAGTVVGSWVMGEDILGANSTQMSIQKLNVTGKCKRVRVTFKHSDDTPCEIYGIGLEFREKKV